MAGVSLETIVFFYDFHGLGGIRSTQPTISWHRRPTVPMLQKSSMRKSYYSKTYN